IHPSKEVRDEAITALGLLDLKSNKSWTVQFAVTGSIDIDDRFERYVVLSPSETILVRQIVDDAEIRRIPFAGELPHVRLSGDGRFLFTVSPPNNHLRVWNLTSTPPALEWDTEVGAVAIPRSRREIALSRRNGVMSLYDPVTRREGKRLQLKTAPSAFA